MDPRQVIDIFVEIESRCDVNALRAEGICIWPIVRQHLWDALQPLGRSNVGPRPATTNSAAQHGRRGRAAQLGKLGARVMRGSRRVARSAFASINRHHPPCPEKTGIVFFCRQEEHRERVQGRYYDLVLDPIMDLIGDEGAFSKWELASESGRVRMPRHRASKMIRVEPGIGDLARRLASQFRPPIDGFAYLQRLLAERTGAACLEWSDVMTHVDNIGRYRRLVASLLDRAQPRVVFLACYYYAAAMGLIWACRDRNIRTVDVQHGKQGKYHGLYTHWTRIPAAGYEVLPDVFWSWGEESKQNIERDQPAGCRMHRAVVGGNRWLGQWMDGDPRLTSAALAAFTQRLAGAGRVILVTLQPIEESLPPFLIEAMRNAPADWMWLVRLHPAQIRGGQTESIRARLAQAGVRNFEIDHVNKTALYEALRASDAHLTAFSSVCYEALAFGVPTTLISPVGRQYYEEYINRGLFQYATTAAELLAAVGDQSARSPMREATPYIETSKAVALSALQQLLDRQKNASPVRSAA